ncbi:hypothetical protein NPS46_18255 [Pseudomonas putida]|uniref:hypothetical protein n=1 Tax=Pseudomonas putida TaxID=303 RepID=UPI0023638255|nr:hypothetical protein [Pseudomonas putida]MDD2054493.1 hypothetical protein [Pseudomonas putida]
MRGVVAVVALVALAGCAGQALNQARAVGPTKTFVSAKAEQVVAQCIQFSWQDEAVFDVDAAAYLESSSAIKGTTVLTRGADYFVDIRSEGGATAVSYYVAKSDKTAPRRLAAVATCL